jgi:hypothetical protein
VRTTTWRPPIGRSVASWSVVRPGPSPREIQVLAAAASSPSALARGRAGCASSGAADAWAGQCAAGQKASPRYVAVFRHLIPPSTLTFDASGDGKTLYQRADQRTPTPLSATRTSQP